MLVTTAYDPSDHIIQVAKNLAEFHRCPYVSRRKDALPKLMSMHQETTVLVNAKDQLLLYEGEGPPLFFHPSMSALRIVNIQKGSHDTLVKYAGIQSGDSVLDCTAGMASDSIVLSHTVGDQGKVIALESEALIYSLVQHGLQSYALKHKDIDRDVEAAMQRIHYIHTEHDNYLKQQPDRSIDFVYFDPMFRDPVYESSWIAPLRNVSNKRPLQQESVSEALRVAKKAVILKERKMSAEFSRLGFVPQQRKESKIAYGVIKVD